MLADLLKRVKNIEAQPLPSLSGAARTVSKDEERDKGSISCSPIPMLCRFSPSSSRSATAAAF